MLGGPSPSLLRSHPRDEAVWAQGATYPNVSANEGWKGKILDRRIERDLSSQQG